MFFLFASIVYSQEIPPIEIFTPQDYGAEDQNWAITQSENNFIYVANNLGLLEYNGATWQLYKSPNNDILRSVRSAGNKVYSGGYMDFGYWMKDQYGKLIYQSLSTNREFKIKEDEQFWGIIDIDGFVLFQSFETIYIYDITNDSFKLIHSDDRINKIFKVNESIYFQKANIGLFKIVNGKEQLISSVLELKDNEIINIYAVDDGLLLQTKENGIYKYNEQLVKKWNTSANKILSEVSVYSAKKLSDGSFILGTISNGIVRLSSSGDVITRIDQSYGLSNNTVLSIEEDNYGNVWLGLDNGINVLNLSSPFKVYVDKQGILGTIYCSAKNNGYLYLGTNQGLFYKRFDADSKFKFIPSTEGQVWVLTVVDGILLCGHDSGTFTVGNDNTADFLSFEKGTWTIKPISSDMLLQGTYKGLSILEKKNGSWKYRNKIDGFNISSRYVELSNNNDILVSHEYKGVYRILTDSNYREVSSYEKLNVSQGAKSGLLKYNGNVFYIYEDGFYKYDIGTQGFQKDSLLSAAFPKQDYLSGKLVIDSQKNRLWGFTKDRVIFIEPGELSSLPDISSIPISSEIRKSKPGYENILHITKDEYLIGSTEGYVIINLDKLKEEPKEIVLNGIEYSSRHDNFSQLSLSESSQRIELNYKRNSLKFSYSITDFDKMSLSEYQYRLKGIYDNWSKWSTNSSVAFENLPHGEYQLEVRGRTSGVITKNRIEYSFIIQKPWYLKPLAIMAYIVLVLMLISLIQVLNKRHYKRQKQKLIENKERELELEQLESQKQIIQFKNENLQMDIENKNRELGTATMNLVKRNELLNDIKVELTKAKTIDDTKNVIRLINRNLNNTSDWKLFEEAFNNVDKDFMRRVKSLHPAITPNDLRLCAYLRLNLSSKEIAPLLNISHKSVEVKRYRLRKKMGLDHEQSLTDYILEL
ncbi:triple tyrosine motif-containing protein [Winogradskyella flava]|uniref:LuxR family transcriptional regulator n=1 Tax=Winogradskyella flava TaxID=1884876 RepID=A0A842IYE4_9FLAO|nr:triple tyrosine motif-containing protein [Winogradskyella flava]MBC2846307.1 LuxR family transcriptional regulator [Winogradskyella flava]